MELMISLFYRKMTRFPQNGVLRARIFSRGKNTALRILPLLLSLLLSGCIEAALVSPGSSAFETESIKRTFTILIPEDSGTIIENTAELFKNQLSLLSNGELEARIIKDYGSSPWLSNGAEVVIISSEHMAAHVPYLNILSLEFIFSGYTNMTMSMNSPDLISVISGDMSEKTGYSTAAAMYMGSWVILSKEDIFDDEDIIRMPTADGVSYFSDFFKQSYMIGTVELPPEVISPLLDDRITWLEIPLIEMFGERGLGAKYMCKSVHHIDIGWINIDNEFLDGLSDAQRAVISEAVAIARTYCDKAYLALEAEIEKMMQDENIWYNSFMNVDQKIEYLRDYNRSVTENSDFDEWLYYKITDLYYISDVAKTWIYDGLKFTSG